MKILWNLLHINPLSLLFLFNMAGESFLAKIMGRQKNIILRLAQLWCFDFFNHAENREWKHETYDRQRGFYFKKKGGEKIIIFSCVLFWKYLKTRIYRELWVALNFDPVSIAKNFERGP